MGTYLNIIMAPLITTKREKMIFTVFKFNLVNRNAPANPPTSPMGTREKIDAFGLIAPFNKYAARETADIGSIVATAFAKTPFSLFFSSDKICDK